jgi:hypothetical protein
MCVAPEYTENSITVKVTEGDTDLYIVIVNLSFRFFWNWYVSSIYIILRTHEKGKVKYFVRSNQTKK